MRDLRDWLHLLRDFLYLFRCWLYLLLDFHFLWLYWDLSFLFLFNLHFFWLLSRSLLGKFLWFWILYSLLVKVLTLQIFSYEGFLAKQFHKLRVGEIEGHTFFRQGPLNLRAADINPY